MSVVTVVSVGEEIVGMFSSPSCDSIAEVERVAYGGSRQYSGE